MMHIQRWAGIKGRLTLLEKLKIQTPRRNIPTSHYGIHPLDMFEIAPRLTTLEAMGLPPVALMHLDKLHTLRALRQDPTGLTTIMSFMSCFPHGLHLCLELVLSYVSDDDILNLDIPPTSSNIQCLSLNIRGNFVQHRCTQTQSAIFEALTLPHLTELTFSSARYPLAWPRGAFLSFSPRSSFQTHLQSLDLAQVGLTELELLESLHALPVLHHLSISDHQFYEGQANDEHGADRLLITSSLFAQLALNDAPPCLVPQLRSLSCRSTLRFDDDAYLHFVLSRCCGGAPSVPPFASKLQWIPGRYRDLEPSVYAQLRELRVRKKISWEFSQAVYGCPEV